MIDYQSVAKWLDDYVAAWKSYEPEAIRALFNEEATYRYNPYDEPLRGRETIVESWLTDRDQPNTYAAEYKPLAINGDTAVSHGRSLYYAADGKTLIREFDNIFVVKFDEDGRCVDFCEWYVEKR